MSKVKRIRFQGRASYQQKEIATYDKVFIRRLDNRHMFPGKIFDLTIPLVGVVNSDGEQAEVRVEMIGGEMDFLGGRPSFSGFVSKGEIAYEEWYRENVGSEIRRADYDKGYDLRYSLSDQYVLEEWLVLK